MTINKIEFGSISNNTVSFKQGETPEQQKASEQISDPIKSKATKLMIGATALASIIALGVCGYKGKFGKGIQKMLGGAEKSTPHQNSIKPHPTGKTETSITEEVRTVTKPEPVKPNIVEDIETAAKPEPVKPNIVEDIETAAKPEPVKPNVVEEVETTVKPENAKAGIAQETETVAIRETKKAAEFERMAQKEILDLLDTDVTRMSMEELKLTQTKIEQKRNILYDKGIRPKKPKDPNLSKEEKLYLKLNNKISDCRHRKTELEKEFVKTKLPITSAEEMQVKQAAEYLNTEEKEALGLYYDMYPHNSALRNGADPSKIEDVVILDGAFKKAPALQEDAVVYRAVHGHPVFKDQNQFIESLKEGTIISDKSYVSTSTNTTNAQFFQFAKNTMENGGVLMRIKVPKGSKGILGGHYEYLLPRNSQIKINKIEVIYGIKVADCEYILPA